jgi:hypothetical protein
MKLNPTLILMIVLSFAGCGNNSGTNHTNPKEQEQSIRILEEATPGTYYTVLRPVNPHANGFIPYGAATFKVQDDSLEVSVVLDDDQPVTHRQALHLGTRCPDSSDDTNGDGFIDSNEALRVVGQVLMPLDADLESQIAGEDYYLAGPSMTYKKTASLARINADLWKTDVTKITPGRGIGFDGLVVLVQGTTMRPHFPASLSSGDDGRAVHLSLPVTCGVLQKTPQE